MADDRKDQWSRRLNLTASPNGEQKRLSPSNTYNTTANVDAVRKQKHPSDLLSLPLRRDPASGMVRQRDGRRDSPSLPPVKGRHLPRQSKLKPGRVTVFTSTPDPRKANVQKINPKENEDGDLTLLLSIDSKKADVEFACSRGAGEEEDEEDDEEEEALEAVDEEPESPEGAADGVRQPAKKPDSNFMVDLLRSGNSSLSLVELFKFKKAFYAADDNDNGVLEWEEFRDAFHMISDDIPESDIMTWFAKIDGDCDGEAWKYH